MAVGKYKCRCYRNPITGESEMLNEHVFIWLLKEGLWQKGICNTPDGYNVHHVDFDRSNNDPDNLVLVSTAEHARIHAERRKSFRAVRDGKFAEAARKTWSLKTPEERAAHMKKAQDAAMEKRKKFEQSDAQKAALKKAVEARRLKRIERLASNQTS